MSTSEGVRRVRLDRASAPVRLQRTERSRDFVQTTLSRKSSMAKPFRLDPNAATALEAELNRALERMDEEAKAKNSGKPEQEGEDRPSTRHSWRVDIIHFLHQRAIHTAATVLLCLDLLIVMISLELQVQIGRLEREAMEHCLHEYETGHAVPLPLLNSTCNPSGLHDCDPHETPAYHQAELLHKVEMGLAIVSCVILSLFLMENIAMMVALRLSYFRHFFFVLDFVVVSISLGLELWAIIASQLEDVEVVLGILIIARMWRFFRVAHGLYFLEHAEEALQDDPSIESSHNSKNEGSGKERSGGMIFPKPGGKLTKIQSNVEVKGENAV